MYIKALHIIFVVSWFAGLLYIIRLFIYHAEASSKPDDIRQALQGQFQLMEWRLWYIITWPAALLATFFGLWLAESHGLWNQGWMQVKLSLVALLWVYQWITHRLFLGFQKNQIMWTSNHLRIWNELATLWLVAIVFVVTLKNALNWIYATLGFIAIGVFLMILIRIYKRLRKE